MVINTPSKAGDVDLIFCCGSKFPHAAGQLSQLANMSPCSPEPTRAAQPKVKKIRISMDISKHS